MRRSILAVLAVSLSVTVLAGCGSDDGGSGADTLEGIKVSGEGADTTIDVGDGAVSLEQPAVRVLDEGDGRELAEGDYARLDYVVFNGDGESQGSTYDAGFGEAVELADPGTNPQSIPGLSKDLIDVLEGVTVGSRILVGQPMPGSTDETVLFVMTIADSTRVDDTEAPTGEAAALPAGIPTPVLDGDSVTGIDGSTAAGEVALTRNVVIEGTGEEVTADQAVVANYIGTVYPSGAVFDSSFERGEPTVFPLTGVIPCWTEQLAGLKVGTRVVLTCPNDSAYGDQERGEIKAGDALTFVVDIRDAF